MDKKRRTQRKKKFSAYYRQTSPKTLCHYSQVESMDSIPPIHVNVQKIKKLVNCVIRSDEILGYFLQQINSHPHFSTAPPLQIYRKLDPRDSYYIGPPKGFMHGLFYDLTHWHYVYHGHSIDSYQQQHQIQDSDNFCSTFALMYLLETHRLRTHYPLRKKAYYHNIRLACKFWIDELNRDTALKEIFEKRIQRVKNITHLSTLSEAVKLFHWGKHHPEEFYRLETSI